MGTSKDEGEGVTFTTMAQTNRGDYEGEYEVASIMKVTLAIDGDGDDEDCDNASEDGGDNEVNDEGEGNNG